jgi:carboxypeptidase C (cathepsin A)
MTGSLMFYSSVAPDEAATVSDENKEQITLEFVEGTHMVPNETPDAISKYILIMILKLAILIQIRFQSLTL